MFFKLKKDHFKYFSPLTTRMHSSWMRTVRLSRGDVWPGGVVCPGGGGCLTRGCGHPWTKWQTRVKTLPCRNYVVDGKKVYHLDIDADVNNFVMFLYVLAGGRMNSVFSYSSPFSYLLPRKKPRRSPRLISKEKLEKTTKQVQNGPLGYLDLLPLEVKFSIFTYLPGSKNVLFLIQLHKSKKKRKK